jgi:GTP pyrophosphokinase
MMESMYYKAMDFAKEHHKLQVDDEGKPYFEHLWQVAQIVFNVTEDEEVLAAAWLHDIIEDTKVTPEQLKELFGQRVHDLVMEVTHEGKKDMYGYYFPRLKSKEAIMIKFADRLSNLSRMNSWPMERQEHYLKRSKFWKDTKTTGNSQ